MLGSSASLPLAPLSETQVTDKGLTEVLTSPNKSVTLKQAGTEPMQRRWEGMGRGAQRPGEDTGYQHLALDGCMAGWHRVGPLRGLLLNPVTIRDESRRWEDDAAGGGGGARQQGSRSHVRDEKLFCSPSKRSIPRDRHHKDLSAPRYPTGACASAAPD